MGDPSTPGDHRFLVANLEQQLRISGDLKTPFANRSNEDLRDAWERTSHGSLVSVESGAGNESTQEHSHQDSGNSEPPTPTHVVLDVDEHCGGQKTADADAEHPPVEEGFLHAVLVRVFLIELVRTKRRHTRFHAPRAYGNEVEREIEETHLTRRRRWTPNCTSTCGGFAAGTEVALWWLKHGHCYWQRQHDQSLHQSTKHESRTWRTNSSKNDAILC